MIANKTNSFFMMAKRAIFLVLFILLINTCFSQKTTGNFYIYGQDGNPTADIKEAVFLLHVFSLNDTIYLSRYYNFKGPMMRQESYKDSNLSILNGRFCWYNSNGSLDSTGMVTEGKKDGNWLYIISKTETHSIEYEMGKKIKEQTFYYDKNGKYINPDSTNEKIKDSTQKEAVFKKGIKDWVSYCQQNLHTPERLQNVLQDGIHTCGVCFLIDKKGNTTDIYLTQSAEWSGDAEVMRLIKESPKWTPAIQKGVPVYYRQKQSLSYQVISR